MEERPPERFRMGEEMGRLESEFDASEASHARAKQILLVLIAVTLFSSVMVMLVFYVFQGPGRLPVQAVRFVLTGSLMGLLYLGKAWARWTTVALYGFALLQLASSLPRTLSAEGSIVSLVMQLWLGVLFATWVVVLVVPNRVTRYFQSRRYC